MEIFENFKDLFIPHRVKVLKKYESEIEKKALSWFKKNFDASFGSTTNCNTKSIITWHYSAGLLMFGIPPVGDYMYHFVIKMIHFEHWQTKEWKEGFKYGKFCSKSDMKVTNDNYRDGNPYAEQNFYSREAWDAGYIMGLSNYSFFKQNKKKG